ncbi:hypothetical protein HMPREF9946_02143 [Acetobacteraceae bacterium AT-5844]|nr:hypothetical protein HMPREF9946_02143 [Acetobacteraceae bacterium AT-5844]
MTAPLRTHDPGKLREPWPWVEGRVRRYLDRGAVVTRQGEWVQLEVPGGAIAWARAEYFDRAAATGADVAAEIAVLPPAPFDQPIRPVTSAALADFLNLAATGRSNMKVGA